MPVDTADRPCPLQDVLLCILLFPNPDGIVWSRLIGSNGFFYSLGYNQIIYSTDIIIIIKLEVLLRFYFLAVLCWLKTYYIKANID